MTLGETLLRKLGSDRADESRSPLIASDAATGWTASLAIDKNDALSCSLAELVCERVGDPQPTRAWADSLVKRVRGLMEPLRVIEVDAQRDEAVLRSDSPTVRNEKRAHYELRLLGGRKATLKRFAAATEGGAKREAVPFALTHEVLGQLVDVLTAPV